MSNFETAITILLKHEGGFVNNVHDAGGITNYGVSLRFLKDHPELGDFDHDGDVDADDIKNMSEDDAKNVYKTCWWDKFNYGLINDQTIATKTFDYSVNMGAKRAHIILQTALNTAFNLNLTCDGSLGKMSFSAINNIISDDDKQQFISAYSDATWEFYKKLITNNPDYEEFRNGWKNRAYSINVANSI